MTYRRHRHFARAFFAPARFVAAMVCALGVACGGAKAATFGALGVEVGPGVDPWVGRLNAFAELQWDAGWLLRGTSGLSLGSRWLTDLSLVGGGVLDRWSWAPEVTVGVGAAVSAVRPAMVMSAALGVRRYLALDHAVTLRAEARALVAQGAHPDYEAFFLVGFRQHFVP